VPTGELPRNILMTVDRSMVGTIAPGTRITAVAIYSTVQVLLCPDFLSKCLQQAIMWHSGMAGAERLRGPRSC